MHRTTQTICQYILSNVTGGAYGTVTESDPQRIMLLWDSFRLESPKLIEQHGKLKALELWLENKPASLDIAFDYVDITEQLIDWGLLTMEPDTEEYMEALNAWYPLIARHCLLLIEGLVPSRV